MADQQSTEMPVVEEANTSLEHILASELYPKKAMTSDEESLQVPFPVLPGEWVEYLGKTEGGVVALSNFRLFIRYKQSFINVPLGLIEYVEYRDIFYINIYCKDARSFRCTFSTNETCLEWYRRLTAALRPPKKLQDVFAFAFRAWCIDPSFSQQGVAVEHGMAYELCTAEDMGGGYNFSHEVERMGFDLKASWRITYLNDDYRVCESYPREHLVPASVTDKELKLVASFRACHRFPSVVWREPNSGAVIARSSQPEIGWLGWRNEEDERLLQAISLACAVDNNLARQPHSAEPKKLLIIDARSYAAAWANRAKGGGCECPEYYPNCEIQFMSLANIHTVRKSFYAIRSLCALGAEQPNWLTGVDNTKWLYHIGLLMRVAVLVVNAIDKEKRPVLVHCSDGWDRTPQIVALAELMLDPYYRTVQGFRVLVEREWLAFGHKFADRCGTGLGSDDVNEKCPVFLQWLDCVHQLLVQFPCAFQFNQAFLVKLAHHIYSGLFGTFLCNTIREREEGKVPKQTNSVWSLLLPNNKKFVNLLYKADTEPVLRPSCCPRHLHLWHAVYLSETAPTAADEPFDISDEANKLLDDSGLEQTPLPKTRSCEDLSTVLDHSSEGQTLTRARRLSDPHITTDPKSLIQSTDSLVSNMEKKERSETMYNGDIKTVSCVSSETLTEASGTVCEAPQHLTLVPDKSSSVVDQEQDGCPTEAVSNNGFGAEMDECETSQYGIATIESPHSASTQDIPEKTLGDTSPQAEVIDSTDTLTDESADSSSSKQTCDNGTTIAKTPCPSSQRQIALIPAGKSGIIAKNAQRVVSRLESDSNVKPSKNVDGQQLGNTSRVASEPGSSFCLEDVLSKLNIESILDTTSLRKDGVEVNTLLPSVSRGSSSGREDTGDGSTSSYQSRTPNSSTGPPTPGTDLKSGPWTSRRQSNMARHLDCDGLTTFIDPVQNRLSQIENEYQQKIQDLTQQLCMAKAIIYQYTAGVNGTGKHLENGDDLVSTESVDSGEQGSLGGGSTAASDASWEQVEARDANMALWVPDHAVTHCAGCDEVFWVIRRKHHCRSCGQVFCDDCTKYYKPVPHQYLPNPERVCVRCYHSVTDGLSAIMADGVVDASVKDEGAVASC